MENKIKTYEEDGYIIDEAKGTYITLAKGGKSILVVDVDDEQNIHINNNNSYVTNKVSVHYKTHFPMLRHGMPECQTRGGDFNLPLDYHNPAEKAKLQGIIENGSIPFTLPMCIDDESNTTKMYVYETKDGLACVKTFYTDKFNSKEGISLPTNISYDLVDYDEMVEFLKNRGLSVEIPKEAASKFVEASKYKGLKGAAQRFINIINSFTLER